MGSVQELKAEAELLGLEGPAIVDYVKEQQERQRSDRAAERELEREKLELERERVAAERESEKERISLERDKAKLEADVQLARIQASTELPNRTSDHDVVRVEKPKLPVYHEGEDLTAYFIRFERVCSLLGLRDDSLAVRLGSTLTGKAAEIYSSLPIATTSDYKALKQALLKAYNRTPDFYRFDFRSAKLQGNETYEQFVTSLSRKLDYWIDSLISERTFDNLKDFIIRDQLLTAVIPELRIFLKEKGAATLQELVTHADNWASAHKHVFKKAFNNKFTKTTPEKEEMKSPTNEKNTPTGKSTPNLKPKREVICHSCGAPGHYKSQCESIKNENYAVKVCFSSQISPKFMTCGTINGCNVSTILRDTGCSCVVVSEDVLPNITDENSPKVNLSDFLGNVTAFPVARCYLKCKYYDGWVDAVIAPIKCCSILLGNISGIKDGDLGEDLPKKNISGNDCDANMAMVVTRSESKKISPHPLRVPELSVLNLTPDEFANEQKNCKSLEKLWEKARQGQVITLRDESKFQFVIDKSLLYRKCIHSKNKNLVGKTVLVLPKICRNLALNTAHDSPLAGHFSHNKTYAKIASSFFWPRLGTDARNYCRSCDLCQKMSQRRTKPVPLVKMPIIETPFSRISMDIVGPLSPVSSEGHRYILTVVDWATGFPEAVPLKTIDSISVAESLLAIFSRVGIPNEILSDQASNFTSQLMGQLHNLLGVKPIFSSIYHAQGNGRQERVHSTLKSCLKKLCTYKPRDWHRYLVATLFAMRELPSSRTGFSAFELLYGRQVRGPIHVLHDIWSNDQAPEEQRNLFQYIIDLRQKLKESAELAHSMAENSVQKFSSYFDLKAKDRKLEENDEVLILLPDNSNKLLMSWKGPYLVTKKLSRVNYVIDCDGKPKVFHINLLKKYFRRANINFASVHNESKVEAPLNILYCTHCPVVDETQLEEKEPAPNTISVDKQLPLECPNFDDSQSKPSLSNTLNESEIGDLENLMIEFNHVLSDSPGMTKTVVHNIELKTSDLTRSKVYPVPLHLRDAFNAEVEKLLNSGIIQRSNSDFCSPVVLVKKPDLTYRLTIDFRTLNGFTRFDAEPSFIPDEDFHKFVGCKYFTELDITKAYYQIELHPSCRHLTAFPTSRGLMEFTRMPFGLVTACATYARLMRIVLQNLEGITFYFDNILIYSKTWEEHIQSLKNVFERLALHGLTVKPSKCNFGYPTIQYLGHIINGDDIKPISIKIDDILNAPPPTTKAALRSFLGLVSYYRKFIPNLAQLTADLSDLLKKGVQEPLSFNDSQMTSFESIKNYLVTDPILKLPDPTKTFVLRTDGSGSAIGAILLQYHGDCAYPVAYASRKLTESERKFSTVERECLAIIFAVQKFSVYLIGSSFVLEVDHRPLVYLNKMKNLNSRLTRWALCLQPYDFSVVYLPGKENVGADYLSRMS